MPDLVLVLRALLLLLFGVGWFGTGQGSKVDCSLGSKRAESEAVNDLSLFVVRAAPTLTRNVDCLVLSALYTPPY